MNNRMSNIKIETTALKTILYGILSCQCPVSEKTESSLFAEYRKTPEEGTVAIAPFLTIADTNPVKTPLHLFVEFASLYREDPFEFTITQDDALRYFSTRPHFDRMLGPINPLTIYDPASHLVGHMMLPVSPGEKDGEYRFEHEGHVIHLKHIVLPPDIAKQKVEDYGVHFGMILTTIDARQKTMLHSHLQFIKEFPQLLERVSEIDYTSYQGLGDYHMHIKRRYERVFPKG